MIVTVLILNVLVVLLLARVASLNEGAQETRERLAHLEGHICGASEPEGDEDEVDDEEDESAAEQPGVSHRPGPAPEPLSTKVN